MGRLKKNFAANIYMTTAGVVGQLCIVPVYLRYWGTELYGAWLVLYTIPALFMFADVGLANAVGNEVSLSVERGQPERAEAVFNAAWKYQALLCCILLATLIGMLWFWPVSHWLGLSELSASDFRIATIFLAIGAFLSLQRGLLSGIYRGGRQYHKYIIWSAHGTVFEYALIGIVLVLGGGIRGVSEGIAFARVAKFVGLLLGARSAMPDMRLSMLSGRWREFRELLPSAASYFSFPVANAIINQGTVLAVNHLLGPSFVVLLSVSRQLARLFTKVSALIVRTLHPEMTMALASGCRSRVVELQRMAIMSILIPAIPFGIITTFLGPLLIKYWTGGRIEASFIVVFFCVFEAVAFSGQQLFSLVSWSSNQVVGLSRLYVVGILVAFVAGTAFAVAVGVVAYPASFAVSSLVFCYCGLRVGASVAGFSFREAFDVKLFFRHYFRMGVNPCFRYLLTIVKK